MVSTFFHPEEEGKKIFTCLSFPIFKLGVTFSTLQEDSQGRVWGKWLENTNTAHRCGWGATGSGCSLQGETEAQLVSRTTVWGREQS